MNYREKAMKNGHRNFKQVYSDKTVTRLQCQRPGCGCSILICHDIGHIRGTALTKACEDRRGERNELSGMHINDVVKGIGMRCVGNEIRSW